MIADDLRTRTRWAHRPPAALLNGLEALGAHRADSVDEAAQLIGEVRDRSRVLGMRLPDDDPVDAYLVAAAQERRLERGELEPLLRMAYRAVELAAAEIRMSANVHGDSHFQGEIQRIIMLTAGTALERHDEGPARMQRFNAWVQWLHEQGREEEARAWRALMDGLLDGWVLEEAESRQQDAKIEARQQAARIAQQRALLAFQVVTQGEGTTVDGRAAEPLLTPDRGTTIGLFELAPVWIMVHLRRYMDAPVNGHPLALS